MYKTSLHRAEGNDKYTVINILTNAFADNKSVNYIIQQDSRREQRLMKLMEYSFDYCSLFGEVYLSEDKNACALLLLPDKKKTSLKSIMLDAKLAWSCIGVFNIKKALSREAKIKKLRTDATIYYLWFIGVQPDDQNRGIGGALLKQLIKKSELLKRAIYLETSTIKNIPWYENFGFNIYSELDFGYKLYCLKRVP